jgi:hypothetical protein
MFNKTKECTGSFSCRFKVVLITSIVIVVAAIASVLLFGESIATR